MSHTLNKHRGMSLIEVLIGSAIILASMLGLITTYNFYLRSSLRNTETIQATFLAEEGLEAMRLIRDESYSTNIATLPTNTPIYLTWNGSKFTTTLTPIIVDSTFSRQIKVFPVYRDSLDRIASAGTLDPNTKKISATVTWAGVSTTTSRSIETYLTNLFNN